MEEAPQSLGETGTCLAPARAVTLHGLTRQASCRSRLLRGMEVSAAYLPLDTAIEARTVGAG